MMTQVLGVQMRTMRTQLCRPFHSFAPTLIHKGLLVALLIICAYIVF